MNISFFSIVERGNGMAKETKTETSRNRTISVKGTDIALFSPTTNTDDYISLTDIAKYRDGRTEVVIQNWIRSRMTIELLGLWETLNNSDFKHIEFDVFRNHAGLNGFVLSPKQWIETPLAWFQEPDVTAVPSRTRILHLNSQLGFR
jgi:hypothetical protein